MAFFVLDTDADFVAVVEHRLVPARARSEGKRLLLAGIRSVWASCVVSPSLCLLLLLLDFLSFSSLVGFFGVICLSLEVV